MVSRGRRIRVLAEARKVVRPVSLSVVAIAILAVVMAFTGWRMITAALCGVIVLIAGLMVFQVHRAVGYLRRQTSQLSRSAAQAEEHYVQMLWGVVCFVEARDRYTEDHSQRVADLCEQIARKMSMPQEVCAALRTAGRLHDLGMIAVPEKIIAQRSRLGVGEFSSVRKHPEVAYEILKPLRSLARALPAIRYHHERMNGTGYPAGLAGQDIPIEARILAVADAYDAMTHDRPHRAAMSAMAAMEELRRCTPAGYDGDCVQALTELKGLARLQEATASL